MKSISSSLFSILSTIMKRLSQSFFVLIAVFSVPYPAFAQTIPLPPIDDLPNIVGSGNQSFTDFVTDFLTVRAKFVLLGVAVFYIVFYGAKMVLGTGNEETIKKSKLALTYAFIGFIIINADYIFRYAFNPMDVIFGRPDPEWTTWGAIMAILIEGLRYIAGVVAVGWLILAGFRMVTAGGKEEVITKQRMQIVWSIFGLIIIALAGTLQKVFFGECETNIFTPWRNECHPEGPQAAASVATSIINLMLMFTAPLGFLLLIIGGMYMILSHGNETMLNRGKKIVQYTVIALVIIYSSYVIVSEVFKFVTSP